MSFGNEIFLVNLEVINLEKKVPSLGNLVELIEEFASSIKTPNKQDIFNQNLPEIKINNTLVIEAIKSLSSASENRFSPVTYFCSNFNVLEKYLSSFSGFQLASKSLPALSENPSEQNLLPRHLLLDGNRQDRSGSPASCLLPPSTPPSTSLNLSPLPNLLEIPAIEKVTIPATLNSVSLEQLPVLPVNATLPIYTFGKIDAETETSAIAPQSNASGTLIKLNKFRSDTRFAGIDGRGFATVILDTGIDVNHSFFGPDKNKDGIADRIVYQYDFADMDRDASDKNGHGSNVSSIVASSDTTYTGVAPGANIIHLKVFKDSGSGSFWYIEQALQWVVNNVATYNIASVNMSLGDNTNYNVPVQDYGISEEMAALAKLDVAVVSASGNSFYSFNSVQGVSYPAADPNSFSVGAVYDSNSGKWNYSSGAKANSSNADVIAPFSQRDAKMTTIFAPGAPITGANWNGGIVTMHGTSQAAPQITGTAVLAQQLAVQELGRRLTVTELKNLLVSTGKTIVDGDDENDNVTNTGLSFKRVDMLALGEAILNLARPQISINSATVTQNEGNSDTTAYTFTVSLSKASSQVITVNYTTNDGTATQANNDYIDNDGMLTFNPGEMAKTITVLVNGDTVVETDETFSVSLNSANNTTINAQAHQVTSTIVNDDFTLLNVGVSGLTKTFSIDSYMGSAQDLNSRTTITSSGNELDIQGNGWKKLALAYNITTNTILEFEFRSTAQGEVQGIGFDTNNQQSTDHFFKVYGSQVFGLQHFNNYASAAGSWKAYRINVGNFFIGQMNFLTFANDHDVTNPTAASQFRNIHLYEATSPSINITQVASLTGLLDQDTLTGTAATAPLVAGQAKDSLTQGNEAEQLVFKYFQAGSEAMTEVPMSIADQETVPLTVGSSIPLNLDSLNDDRSLLPLIQEQGLMPLG